MMDCERILVVVVVVDGGGGGGGKNHKPSSFLEKHWDKNSFCVCMIYTLDDNDLVVIFKH